MTLTFTEFFNQKVLQERLPFKIDFEIETIPNETFTEVSGFKLRTKNALTTAESWFFETIDSLNNGAVTDLGLTLRSILKAFKNEFKLKDLNEANDLFFGSLKQSDLTEKAFEAKMKKIRDSEEFEFFEEEYQEDIQRLNEGFQLAQDQRSLNWLRVTFFMKTRYDVNWTMGKTAMLSDKEVGAIVDFIMLEANEGVKPEPVDTDGVEIEGKLPQE